MSTIFFTRLTPNFNDWDRPSGIDGKCHSANPLNPLYEEINGFGWEEWLFQEYLNNIDNPDYTCNGFIQAFNGINEDLNFLKRLYLFTKVCNNEIGVVPGCYYIGYIDNVRRIGPFTKDEGNVRNDLQRVGINHKDFLPMLQCAFNISFKVKDVHLGNGFVFDRPVALNRGQYRFALYNLTRHHNFLIAINNYL